MEFIMLVLGSHWRIQSRGEAWAELCRSPVHRQETGLIRGADAGPCPTPAESGSLGALESLRFALPDAH